MKKVLRLKAIGRNETGKGSARKFREKGMFPAVLYGSSFDSIKLVINLIDFQQVFKDGKVYGVLFDLELNSVFRKVTIKEIQRKPVTRDILHVDFYEVAMNRKIKVNVPIVTIGVSKGVELGGVIQINKRELEVLCLPDNIPESISIDITGLDIGDSFHVADLFLSDEIDVLDESGLTILTVLGKKEEEEKEKEISADKDSDIN